MKSNEIHFQSVIKEVDDFRKLHKTDREVWHDIMTFGWIAIHVGRLEDEAISNWVCQASPTKMAVEKKWCLASTLRQLLADQRVLIIRVNKKSHWEIKEDF